MPAIWKAVFLVAITGNLARSSPVEDRRVIVVSFSGVEAYDRVIEVIRGKLPAVRVLDARDEVRMRESFVNTKPPVVIAIGVEAANALERFGSLTPPLLKTLISEIEADRPPKARLTLTVDLPAPVLLEALKRYFPGKTRFGLLRGPAQSDEYIRAFEQAARQAGLSVVILNCGDARNVVSTFLQFRGQVDFVWCPPNMQLYTSATLKPILIASITNRLPIIGFSEQFVQAGALFGGGPDLTDVAQQTAMFRRADCSS